MAGAGWRAVFCGLAWMLSGTASLAGAQTGASGPALPQLPRDPGIAAALASIQPAAVQADINKLVSFRTRNTLSSMSTDLAPGQGVLPAADWIEAEFRAISSRCGGCLEVRRDSFTEPGSTEPRSRIPAPTRLVNVYAVLHGTGPATAPWTLVTGHYDSRATDVMNPKLSAPGANDDASGVAVSIESARALSRLHLSGTVVFVAVAGEEQGLNGSRHLARVAKAEGWPLVAVLNDDIVGGDTTPGDPLQDKDAVRVFSESVPAAATPDEQRQMLALGEENDSPSRELAREVAEVAPVYFAAGVDHLAASHPGPAHVMVLRQEPAFHPVLVLRRDRYLRGGDHTSFNAEGFAAVRFTEWRENFNHQHQTLRSEGGTEDGDLPQFVDPAYVAEVARLNAAVLASLADAPSEPVEVRIATAALDNDSELRWQPGAYAPPGTTYEVLWRPTGSQAWTAVQSAGPATRLKLPVSKDNVLFGVRSVGPNGHRSLPVPPLPAR